MPCLPESLTTSTELVPACRVAVVVRVDHGSAVSVGGADSVVSGRPFTTTLILPAMGENGGVDTFE